MIVRTVHYLHPAMGFVQTLEQWEKDINLEFGHKKGFDLEKAKEILVPVEWSRDKQEWAEIEK